MFPNSRTKRLSQKHRSPVALFALTSVLSCGVTAASGTSQCLATYSDEKKELNVPCISADSLLDGTTFANGGIVLKQANSYPSEIMFRMHIGAGAQQFNDMSRCVANISQRGDGNLRLHVPCVEAKGVGGLYEIEFTSDVGGIQGRWSVERLTPVTQIKSNGEFASGTIGNENVAFGWPLIKDNGSNVGGVSTYSGHCGVDFFSNASNGERNYAQQNGEDHYVAATNFGKVVATRYSYTDPTAPQDISHVSEYNHVKLVHVLQSGNSIWSSYLHLRNETTGQVQVGNRVSKGQRIGREGRTGYTSGNTGVHLHYEIDTSATTNGAATSPCLSASSAHSIFQAADNSSFGDYPNYYSSNSTSYRALIPYLARTTLNSTNYNNNYDVYGVIGLPVYGYLPLSSAVVGGAVGIGGRSETNAISDIFINSVNSNAGNLVLYGSNTFNVLGDYRFFAYREGGWPRLASDSQPVNGGLDLANQGYDIKFSIINSGDEIVDNDTRGSLSDSSCTSMTGSDAYGKYNACEAGARNVPGYYLTAKLFVGGNSDQWAKWYPSNRGNYRLYVHVPEKATATAVQYKIYPRGRNPNGSCLDSDTTYPCYLSDLISHSSENRWVQIVKGSTTEFAFELGGYVGLAASSQQQGSLVGVDAVKFVLAPGGSTPTPTPTPTSNDDHGNSTGVATVVQPVSSTAGRIETAGDNDYFRINIPSNGSLTVSTTGNTDTYGYLLDSNGQQLAYNDDSNGTANFTITQAVSAGTYYVRVRHYSGSGTGAYTLVSSFY